MYDKITSGIGGEITDSSFRVTGASKPLWQLRPLPLAQVNPQALKRPCPRGPAKSLQSSCLTVLSREFHNLRPNALTGLPGHLVARVMARVNMDRGYEADSPSSTMQPDSATMWACIALGDPDGAAKWSPQRQLALPSSATLAHLPRTDKYGGEDADHPLNALPALYASLQPVPRFPLLTTLTLVGMDTSVNNASIQALKFCTHLTALWMKGCTTVTDDGIRLLAMALVLPGAQDESEGRGMWRLRAWYLPGCKGVSDRSLKSFARWPGLSVLDLRDTSCTEAAPIAFNTANKAVFSGLQPEFKACTAGLRDLFTQRDGPEQVLNKLCLTLLKSEIPDGSEERRHLAFHLTHTDRTPPDEWLHEPRSKAPKMRATDLYNPNMSYRHGVGRVFGNGVKNLEDETGDLRERARIRGEIENTDIADAHLRAKGKRPEKRWWNMTDDERYAAAVKRNKELRESRWSSGWGHVPHIVGKKFKDKAADADARSRAFAMATNRGVRVDTQDAGGYEVVKGDKRVMLVRVVHPQWRRLEWANLAAQRARAEAVVRPTKRARVTTDLAEMLSFIPDMPLSEETPEPNATQSSSQASALPTSSQDTKPSIRDRKPSSQDRKPRITDPLSPELSWSSPGRKARTSATPTPRKSQLQPSQLRAQAAPWSSSPPSSSPPSDRIATPPPPASAPFNPFRRAAPSKTASGVRPLDARDDKPDLLAFASSGRKRAFGGASEAPVDVKRKGMRMFG